MRSVDNLGQQLGVDARCFVIGPIGNKFDPIGSPGRETYEQALEVLEKVIVPACATVDVEPIRADQIAVSGAVTTQVLRHLYEDEIVIADVSGGNPNVMYELGLRHTRPLLTVLIGEFGQLPFDIADVRTIQFSRSERGLIDARKALEVALTAGLAENPEPLAATQIWLEGPDGEEPTVLDEGPEGAADAVNLDENGLIEQLAAIEDSFPELTTISESVMETLQQLGDIASGSSTELQTANAPGVTAKDRLNIIARFAKALQPPADDLTRTTGEFWNRMSLLDGEINGLLEFIEKHPEFTSSDEVDSFLDSIAGLARSTREAMENLRGFGGIVVGLGDLSRTLRRPTQQIGAAIGRMTDVVSFVDTWESKAHRVRQVRGM